jgi:GT2 family glycosyltransferase
MSTGAVDTEPPTVSVVIPNLNGRNLLGRCLEQLREQTVTSVETIVVDNASEDDSVAFLESDFPEAQVVSLEANRGFAGGMNAGIQRARGAYVAFLNNDAEVDTRWLEELLACLERHPRAAAATSKLLFADRRNTIDGAGDELTPSFLPYPRGHGEPDRGQFEEEAEVFSPAGAASLWRRSALEDVGLFDERFFAYYEDVDLGFRARLKGYQCWYAPNAVAYHQRGATAGAQTEFTLFHPIRNRWFLILKNVPRRLLLRNALLLMLGEGFLWLRAVRARKPSVVIRAYSDVLSNLRELRRERGRIQKSRRLGDADVQQLLRRPS